jgi:hypothetical protein
MYLPFKSYKLYLLMEYRIIMVSDIVCTWAPSNYLMLIFIWGRGVGLGVGKGCGVTGGEGV